ncbi:MAG: ATP-binding protein [Mojavia pulchra JT2-VF2]|uniref:ATP-binding protein n=1 Tax=Mojavia pulchra JT2-VF2 TaxID=287848 RepID=A0A951UK93_9NOST|nr:ATP-binding protein [Mojavia pulchra JT2-VF2]
MDTKPSDLNQRSYSLPPRLNLAIMASITGAVICGIAAHVGDGIAKKELCFYPQSARIHDAPIEAGVGNPDKLLLGKKYCRYEQRSQIPEPYLKANQYRTSNPNYNPWAFLQHYSLYVFRSLPADNPFKIHLGIGAMVLGAIGLWATSRARDYLSERRPHYRATKLFVGVKANYSLKLGEQLLELSGNELIKYLRGIKIAEARQQFIASITPQQVTALLMAMNADDYYEFGHLLDGGASFSKFEPPQAQLPHGEPGTVEEKAQQPVIANGDKYQWMKNAIGYPALLFGGMGSGKSWTTREIVWQKVNAGWDVVALDPHGTEVEWRGVKLISGYDEIAEFMQWYMDEMRRRYDAYRKSGMTEEQWTQHLRDSNQHFSVICEEFTTWSDHIVEPCPSDAEDFKPDPDFIGKWFRCAMTESRKQLMIPLFVAHDRTMEILGKARGLSKLRDAALLEIELIAHVDPITTEAKASGMGKIKLPGHGQWLPIELPKLDRKRTDFRLEEVSDSHLPEPTVTAETKAQLEELYWRMEFEIDEENKRQPAKKLSQNADSLFQFLGRTNRNKASISEVQPNFKVKGNRFSADEIKRLFNELVECGLSVWVDTNTIEISPNQPDGHSRQN